MEKRATVARLAMARKIPTEQLNPALAATVGRPRTVLVVGAGSGASCTPAVRAGAQVTAVEGDPDLARRAERLADAVIVHDALDVERVSEALGDRRFDLVLIPDLLERAPRPEQLLRRYSRLLVPEGRVAFSVRNRAAWPLRAGLPPEPFGFVAASGGAPVGHSRDEAAAMVRAAGLQPLHVDLNPLLLRAARSVLSERFDLSLKPGEEAPTGYRDLSAYQMYLASIRPLEAAVAQLWPTLLAYQHVVVARREPAAGPLSLTVGMLTMDEEPSIARMIEEIRGVAPDARIVCVDSSVKDQTPVIAERLGARVLRQLPPRGHGPAMELLMYEAARESDALIYLDCDFTYPPQVIPELRAILESGVDVVNAARTRVRPAAMPWPNYLANKSFALCARAMHGVTVADLHSGMRGYRTSVIRAFRFDGEGDALPIDTLLWPARCGYRVVEVPIEYQERVGYSKLRKLAGTVWTFIRLGRTLQVGTRRSRNYQVWPTLEGQARIEPD